ncbi:hypothetical protein MMC07_008140 [Pseudocyphellaria aurata]|nr:hypothetical protein [Pseudocyphellaria aurata]
MLIVDFNPMISHLVNVKVDHSILFWNADGKSLGLPQTNVDYEVNNNVRMLKLMGFYTVNSDEVPPGFRVVPVSADDKGTENQTTMVAASEACQIKSAAAEVGRGVAGRRDGPRPAFGRLMYEKNE